jgi:hypothetical protein
MAKVRGLTGLRVPSWARGSAVRTGAPARQPPVVGGTAAARCALADAAGPRNVEMAAAAGLGFVEEPYPEAELRRLEARFRADATSRLRDATSRDRRHASFCPRPRRRPALSPRHIFDTRFRSLHGSLL